jgi:hypothetical protein
VARAAKKKSKLPAWVAKGSCMSRHPGNDLCTCRSCNQMRAECGCAKCAGILAIGEALASATVRKAARPAASPGRYAYGEDPRFGGTALTACMHLAREARAARLAEARAARPAEPEKPSYAHLFVNPYTR